MVEISDTEYQQIQDRLKELEHANRMVTVVRDSNDAIIMHDFEGKITAWNHGAERMYGYSEKEALQMNIWRLTPPNRESEQRDFTRRVIAGEDLYSFETQRLTKDGRLIDVWLTVTKIVDASGKVIVLASAERDITERKQKAKEANLKMTVMHDSNDAIILHDLEGKITAWNLGAERMFGYSEKEALKMTIWQLSPSNKEAEQREFVGRLFAGEKVYSFVTQRRAKDGHMIDVWLTATKLVDDEGKIFGIAATERDITDRKRAEQQLRELIESMPDGILVVNDKGLIVNTTTRAEILFGYSREELLGQTIEILIPERFRAIHVRLRNIYLAAPAKRVMGSGLPLFALRKDGSEFPVDISLSTVKAVNGQTTFAVVRDITERKQSEENLRTSEQRSRTLLENLPQRIFIKDIKSVYIMCNKNYAADLKIKLEEIAGKTDFDFYPKEFADKYRADDKMIIESGKATEFEEEYILEGHEISILTTKAPIRNEKGNIVGLVGIFSDITMRKQAEKKAKASELRYRRLFESAKDGILILDYETGAIVDVNPFLEGLLEYPAKELLGKHLWEIGSFKDVVASKEAYLKLQTEDYIRYENLPLRTRTGKKTDVEFISNVYLVDDKKVIQCNVRDITERVRAEEMKKAREVAEAASLAKSDFLANMSHELRTPLNSIIGFSEVLFDETFGPLNEKQKSYLNDVLTSGQHLLSLINDILDLSRVESGKMELAIATFSLKQLLEESFVLIKEKALKHNITICSEIPDEVGEISADERKVKQVVYNLLSNAVKFTPDGGKLGVRARKVDDYMEVSVWDTGIGISVEDKGKIFEKFTQLANPYSKKIEGSGLGLALAKSLVEFHAGKIWVESEGKDKGSTFSFTLPIKQMGIK